MQGASYEIQHFQGQVVSIQSTITKSNYIVVDIAVTLFCFATQDGSRPTEIHTGLTTVRVGTFYIF
jgi:hypothetical protein